MTACSTARSTAGEAAALNVFERLEARRLLAAQTIQVTTGADQVTGMTVVGSLRAAIAAANAAVTGTVTTISFSTLPANTPIVLDSALPTIDAASTVIDGTTAASGRVEIDGNPSKPTDANAAGTGFNALDIDTSGVVIKGLSLKFCATAITLGAGATGNTITDNYIGDVTNSGSGTNQIGIKVTAGASGNTIGGTTSIAANVISGNLNNTTAYQGTGIQIDLGTPGFTTALTTGNIVEGNLIGLTPDGTTAAGNGIGILLNSVRGNTIENNQICGSTYTPGAAQVSTSPGQGAGGGSGIVTLSTLGTNEEYNNIIEDNFIGQSSSGTAIPNQIGLYVDNGATGLLGDSFTGNTVSSNTGDGFDVRGSDNSITMNTLESNGGTGVVIESTGERNTISHNVIALNGTAGSTATNLGIDLGADGVTANTGTSGTTATGANGLTPFPVLSVTGGTTVDTVSISLTANPSTTYTIELFGNTGASRSTSNHGQGLTYLGSVSLVTDSTGVGTASSVIATSLLSDDITATATNASPYNVTTNPDAGATSEFSRDALAIGGSGQGTSNLALHVGASVILNEGATTLDKTDAFFVDSSGGTGPYTVTVNYGDGTGLQNVAFNSSDELTLTHAYPGHVSHTYVATVTVYTATSASTHIFDVTVVNDPPHGLSITQSKRNAPSTKAPFLSTASFLDAGAGNGDAFRIYITYGDGTKTFRATTQHDTFGVGHQYKKAGTYTLTVTVIDAGGGENKVTKRIVVA